MTIEHCKLLYNYITVTMLVFCLIDSRTGFESWWHKEFNLICYLAVIINFIIIILTHHQFVSDGFWILTISNGSIFVVSLMILMSATRHGEFNN